MVRYVLIKKKLFKDMYMDPIEGHIENSRQLNSFQVGTFIIFIYLMSSISDINAFSGISLILMKIGFFCFGLNLLICIISFIFAKNTGKTNVILNFMIKK